MVLRMVEYDFMIGLSMAEDENGIYQIQFPRSCVIYLRHNGNTPTEEKMELEFQDGQRITYRVPAVQVQSYNLDEIFEKQLYIFLPFYIMRYEKDMNAIATDVVRKSALLEEYEDILERLEKALQDEPDVYQDLLQLMRRVADHQLSKQDCLKEEVAEVMGGKVLPLPSDKLREAAEAARAEGKAEGKAESVIQLLAAYGDVPAQVIKRVYAEKNTETLNQMLQDAAKAGRIQKFEDKWC